MRPRSRSPRRPDRRLTRPGSTPRPRPREQSPGGVRVPTPEPPTPEPSRPALGRLRTARGATLMRLPLKLRRVLRAAVAEPSVTDLPLVRSAHHGGETGRSFIPMCTTCAAGLGEAPDQWCAAGLGERPDQRPHARGPALPGHSAMPGAGWPPGPVHSRAPSVVNCGPIGRPVRHALRRTLRAGCGPLPRSPVPSPLQPGGHRPRKDAERANGPELGMPRRQ